MLIPVLDFRLMVGMGLIMLAVSWLGILLRWRGRLETARWFFWGTFLSFPTGFVAMITGWFTAEVGRQPWVVYGLLRTKDAVTPSLTTGDVLFSLLAYIVVYVGDLRVRLAITSTSCCATGRRKNREPVSPQRPLAAARCTGGAR